MGDEFFVNFSKDSKPSLEELERELCLLGSYSPERKTEKSVAFRWSAKDRRLDWPEDFTVYDHGQALILNIHSGNGQEIQKIVQDVKVALQRSGNTVVSIEEI